MNAKTKKRLIASGCAVLMAATAATGAFAADKTSGNSSQKANEQPAQEMMQNSPQGAPSDMNGGNMPAGMPDMNSGNRPADLPGMNGENKPAQGMMQNGRQGAPSDMSGGNMPAGMPDMNSGNRPADLPGMNGENKPAEVAGMEEGKLPSGSKEGENLLNEIGESGESSDDSVSSLVDDYNNAVDSERNATNSDSKMTAAKLVKNLVDAINKALEKLGLSVRLNAPADKQELPATGESA